MLHGSPYYKFVVVEEFGIVSSYNPRTVFGDVQTMVVVSEIPLLQALSYFHICNRAKPKFIAIFPV